MVGESEEASMHVPFDAVAVNYRRTMQKQGFAYYPYLNEVEEDT